MGNFVRCVIACLWCESVRLQLVQVISTLLNLNEHWAHHTPTTQTHRRRKIKNTPRERKELATNKLLSSSSSAIAIANNSSSSQPANSIGISSENGSRELSKSNIWTMFIIHFAHYRWATEKNASTFVAHVRLRLGFCASHDYFPLKLLFSFIRYSIRFENRRFAKCHEIYFQI